MNKRANKQTMAAGANTTNNNTATTTNTTSTTYCKAAVQKARYDGISHYQC
jgi:hypothetical protein